MMDSETRQLNRGRRVREFVSTLTATFPAGSRGAALFAAVDAAITEVEEQAARQDAANLDRQESTEQKETAINALLEKMRAINRTARSLNKQLPGLADQFKMARGSTQAIVTRARAFITAATPIQTEFTSRGLPDTLLTDLQAAIDAVAEAEARQSAALAEQMAATAEVAAALRQERDAVRELNAIMLNKFRDDASTLAAWESASRIESAPKKAKKSPAPSS
jgi:phage-related tail protein